jgi:magnesium transporter
VADRKKKRRAAHLRKKRKKLVRRRAPVGSPPGTLVVEPGGTVPDVHLVAYGPEGLEERVVSSAAELVASRDGWPVVWVNVDGLGSEATIRELGEAFGLHKLVLEDIVHTGQRAKVEAYEDYLYVVLHQPVADTLETEQVSLVLARNAVLTFQERPGDAFEPVRERLRQGKGMIRQRGADYLAYALVDAVIDSYFPVLERVGDELEVLEEEVLERPEKETVTRIHEVRRDLLGLRKAAWPHRDMANALVRDAGAFVTPETALYLRDVYDHAIRILDLVEAFREVSADLMNTYLSAVSNRMNEIMKVLTIIATIFIPLSFIAGVYGMNFDRSVSRWNMPELGWTFGYPVALGLMAGIAVAFLVYFRRKGWLG